MESSPLATAANAMPSDFGAECAASGRGAEILHGAVGKISHDFIATKAA
jgi:hypothetical protein